MDSLYFQHPSLRILTHQGLSVLLMATLWKHRHDRRGLLFIDILTSIFGTEVRAFADGEVAADAGAPASAASATMPLVEEAAPPPKGKNAEEPHAAEPFAFGDFTWL